MNKMKYFFKWFCQGLGLIALGVMCLVIGSSLPEEKVVIQVICAGISILVMFPCGAWFSIEGLIKHIKVILEEKEEEEE